MVNVKIYDIHAVARYIALSSFLKQITVSPLKLQKLLYYAQSWSMVFFGRERQLFGDVPQAWVNGPVYPAVYNDWRDRNMCNHLHPNDFGVENQAVGAVLESLVQEMALTDDDMQLLEQIVLKYGSQTQNHLIFLTHSELPWCEMREGLKPFERSHASMSLDTMYAYYKERHEKNIQRRQNREE